MIVYVFVTSFLNSSYICALSLLSFSNFKHQDSIILLQLPNRFRQFCFCYAALQASDVALLIIQQPLRASLTSHIPRADHFAGVLVAVVEAWDWPCFPPAIFRTWKERKTGNQWTESQDYNPLIWYRVVSFEQKLEGQRQQENCHKNELMKTEARGAALWSINVHRGRESLVLRPRYLLWLVTMAIFKEQDVAATTWGPPPFRPTNMSLIYHPSSTRWPQTISF